jgi:hypothetical protein
MYLIHLPVEDPLTTPSNQFRKPLNHTAQTSRLGSQRRGFLLLRQPSQQASKSRLPTLKHSLESRASKPIQNKA